MLRVGVRLACAAVGFRGFRLLPLVDLYGVVDDVQDDARLGQDVAGFLAGVVATSRHDSGDAGTGDEHGAYAAGLHRAVHRRSFEGKPIAGGLDDGVLLGMHCADTVLAGGPVLVDDLLEIMSGLVTMRHSGRRPYVAGADDPFVTHDHAAALAPVACRSRGDFINETQKVLIPGRSLWRVDLCHPGTIPAHWCSL